MKNLKCPICESKDIKIIDLSMYNFTFYCKKYKRLFKYGFESFEVVEEEP